MSRLRSQGWFVLAVSFVSILSGILARPASAGGHSDRCERYDVVQGYILQPSATTPAARSAGLTLQLQSPAQPATSFSSAQSPAVTAAPQPQAQVSAAPAINLQVAAPAPTMQVSYVPATVSLQTVAVTQAPAAVQYVQVQAAPAPTVALAPQVQVVAQSQVSATPVQLLLPHRCHLSCHFFGH
jgi:hypothetical protein